MARPALRRPAIPRYPDAILLARVVGALGLRRTGGFRSQRDGLRGLRESHVHLTLSPRPLASSDACNRRSGAANRSRHRIRSGRLRPARSRRRHSWAGRIRPPVNTSTLSPISHRRRRSPRNFRSAPRFGPIRRRASSRAAHCRLQHDTNFSFSNLPMSHDSIDHECARR